MARLPFRSRKDIRPATPDQPGGDETRAHVAGAASAAAADVALPPAVEPDPTAAAFFDVDNTMMMGASLFWFARGLAARKYFTARDMAGFVWQQAKFRIGGNEGNADDVNTIRENALAFVAGRPVSEIVQASEEIYDELMADRIWAGTRALAQQHLDNGQRVWLVTATPVELASIIAQRLGLTGALGTVAEVVDGAYTGRLVGELMHGPAKAEAVLALAEREGLDLERCTAYSDSANDLPMLSLVGTAVAINPDTELRAVAKARGWTVRDFRTGRKAAKYGLPALAAAALSGGAVGGAIALRRRNDQKAALAPTGRTLAEGLLKRGPSGLFR
ncbi:HAD-IB family hydrolase [Blastococcus sp. CCUG 61487]|uniref:HAD family hydrolase n=1 Tax=Blastococcus sp. CCUG 61487 TaxID=1840703 RepID=UPI00201E47B5|nr:HAD-IB family hydrolase [Blastococcus sp. CCUG 61487]